MKKHIISGYAALWNVRYSMGGYDEMIAREALDGVDMTQCRLLYNHDPNKLLASAKSGTLTVRVDSKGLFYRATLPDTHTGNEVAALLARHDISASSWGFSLGSEGKSWSADGKLLTITKVRRLLDVSPVVYPANDQTTATIETPVFSESKSSDTEHLNPETDWEIDFARRERVYYESQLRFSEYLAQKAKDEDLARLMAIDWNSPEERAKHARRVKLNT